MGRKGVYYSHTIIVKEDDLLSGSIDPMDLDALFVKSNSEVSVLINAFRGSIINLPLLKVPKRLAKLIQTEKVTKYFKSELALSLIIDRIIMGSGNLAVLSPRIDSKNSDFEIFAELIKCLPRTYLPVTYSTFSNNPATEFKLFSIIEFPQQKIGNGIVDPSQYLVIDPYGTYFPYKNTYSEKGGLTSGQFLAKAIISNNIAQIHQFNILYDSYPNNIDPYAKALYASSEVIFAGNRSLELAFYLMSNAISREKNNKYLKETVELVKNEKDLAYLVDYFISSIKAADSLEVIKNLLIESLDIFSGITKQDRGADSNESSGRFNNEYSRIIVDFIKSIIVELNSKKIVYNYEEVFIRLSDGLSPGEILAKLLNDNEFLYDIWLDNFVTKHSAEVDINTIKPLIMRASSRKETRKIFSDFYKRLRKDTPLKKRNDLIKQFLTLDRADLDLAFDLYKDILKDLKNEPSRDVVREVVSLSTDFVRLGMRQSEVNKTLGKYVEIN